MLRYRTCEIGALFFAALRLLLDYQISSADPENDNGDRAEQAASALYSEVAGNSELSRHINKKRARAAKRGAGTTRPAKYHDLLQAKTRAAAGAGHSRGGGR